MSRWISAIHRVRISVVPSIECHGLVVISIPGITGHEAAHVGGVVTSTQVDVTGRLGVFAGEAVVCGSRAVVQVIDPIRIVGFGKDDVAVGVGHLAHRA